MQRFLCCFSGRLFWLCLYLYEALADICRSKKDYLGAENYLKLAIAECEMSGNEDGHLADFTLAQSLLRFQQGKKEEAKGLLVLACNIHPSESGNFQVQFIDLANEDYKVERDIEKSTMKFIGSRNFAELEKLASSLRLNQAKDSTGYLRMHQFYSNCGIAGLGEDDVPERINVVREWVKKFPQSATAKIALAQIMIDYAWQARGSGYADTISREGGRLFEQRLKEAWTQLAAIKDRPADWYRWALKTGLGQGWARTRYEQVYSECRKKYPTVDEVIWSKAMWLLPKWYGEIGESGKFLNAELKKRSGVDADVFYAQTVMAVEGGAITNLDSFNWQRMRKGFEEIIRRYPKDSGIKASFLSWAISYNDSDTLKSLGIKAEYLPPPSVHDASKIQSDFNMEELEKRRVAESDLEGYNRTVKENPGSWEARFNRGEFYNKEERC